MVEPVSIGASILASSVVNYLSSKGKRMYFLNEAVDNAASNVAEDYESLDSDIFIAIFEDDQVVERVKWFDDSGELIEVSDIAEAFNDEMLGEEVEATPEELVEEFLNELEREISQDGEIGRKLLTYYSQRIHAYSEEISESQEEILFELLEIKSRIPTDKGYDVFKPIPERFSRHKAGKVRYMRYDLPFVGRDDELQRLIDFPNSDTDVLIYSGRAGIGKTRLVVEGSYLLEAENPEWEIYWTDIDTGNIDEGLDELDLGDDMKTILFVDDARDADQVTRLFDLARQHECLKLIFAERSYFAESLENEAYGFKELETETVQLQQLNTNHVHNLLKDYYGITDPNTLEFIARVSEGIPLIVHLIADQYVDEDQPNAENWKETFEVVFDDVINDVTSIAEERGFGDPKKLERYVKYLSALGELNTDNDELLERFRDTISIGEPTELDYRDALTDNIGLIVERSGKLTIEPDALQEYIVYDTFFTDSPHDYQNQIQDNFREFTSKAQINQLAIIHRRHGCREARKILRGLVNEEIDRMNEYGFAERVRVLRRFENLSHSHPQYSIELVKATLEEELPEDSDEEKLRRSSAYTRHPAGDLVIESIRSLSRTVQSRPEEATDLLLRIAVQYPFQSQLRTNSVEQKLRQAMRPSFRRPASVQKSILSVIREWVKRDELEKKLRIELVDIIGETSSISIHDFSVDPIDNRQMRTWEGKVRKTDSRLELRNQAINVLCEIISDGDLDTDVRKEAAEKLASFEKSQSRYHHELDEVFSQDELKRILNFSIKYVSQDGNLRCIDALSGLAECRRPDELGIEEEVEELKTKLDENQRYQILRSMKPKPKTSEDLGQREERIRKFIRDIDETELNPSDFDDIVSEVTDESFNQFFYLLGNERPSYGEDLLEEDSPALEDYFRSILPGLSSADPERGKRLVDEYIEEDDFVLASAGLKGLTSQDLDFVQGRMNEILEGQSSFSPESVSGLSKVVHGYWDDEQEWTESVLLTLFQKASSLEPASVENLLRPLPLHKEKSKEIDAEILEYCTDYLEAKEFSKEGHGVGQVVTEVAERDPKSFIDSCFQRLENGYDGVSLLPAHLDVDTERMRDADSYDDAVNLLVEHILDVDYYNPVAFSDLIHVFPTSKVSERLLSEIPDCSEEQLLRIIWSFKLRSVNEDIEEVYLKILTDGDQTESVENVMESALYTDSTAKVGSNKKKREISMLREWQRDDSLPSSVQTFAEETEDYLLDTKTEHEDLVDDLVE